MGEKRNRLLVMYASQTGNAMDAAERVGREAERGGCPGVAVLSMDEFDASNLPDECTVIFFVSTTGQGDMPDSMKVFWRFLLQRNLTHQWLEGLNYAVFGLGDSGYQKYNFAAKKLDKRLMDLGAKPIIEKGLGDDQHPSGYEGALDPWLLSLWSMLNQINSVILPRVSDILDPHRKFLDHAKFQIIYHSVNKGQKQFAMVSDLSDMNDFGEVIEQVRSMSPVRQRNQDNRPHHFLQMVTNQQLTKAGLDRDVRHFEFESVSSALEYQVGDVLEILPSQNPDAVDAFIKRCNLDPDCYITVQPRAFEKECLDSNVNGSINPVKLKTFVAFTMDIASASPRRYFFELFLGLDVDPVAQDQARARIEALLNDRDSSEGEGGLRTYTHVRNFKYIKSVLGGIDEDLPLSGVNGILMDLGMSFMQVMSFYATAEHEKERLQYFASPEGRDDLYQYNQKERRTVLEVLEDFPSVQMPFEWLVQLVPQMKPRAFSISSSPLAHPNQVHLTVAIVSWATPFKRKRSGLCSTWLAGLNPSDSNVYVPAWIRRGFLPPPPPSLPLILVGPGTGCAPFYAFVEERAKQSINEPTSPILFFFGCRNEGNDFLYKNFWLSHAEDGGVLSTAKGAGFFVAFSRDQSQKVYVQHKMKEESRKIWGLLSEGAAIYVAGSSTKMPADVTLCLEEIISEESGASKESATRWLRSLEKAGRLYIETWS